MWNAKPRLDRIWVKDSLYPPKSGVPTPRVFESPAAMIRVTPAAEERGPPWAPVTSEREAARTRPTSRLARNPRAIRLGVLVVFPRGSILGRGNRASLHIGRVKFIRDESWSENAGPSTRAAGSWTGRSG